MYYMYGNVRAIPTYRVYGLYDSFLYHLNSVVSTFDIISRCCVVAMCYINHIALVTLQYE